MKKINKAFIDLNKSIDDDYKKLCDRFESLTLSHNRKKQALKILFRFFDEALKTEKSMPKDPDYEHVFSLTVFEVSELRRLCNDALFSDGRVKAKCERRKK